MAMLPFKPTKDKINRRDKRGEPIDLDVGRERYFKA